MGIDWSKANISSTNPSANTSQDPFSPLRNVTTSSSNRNSDTVWHSKNLQTEQTSAFQSEKQQSSTAVWHSSNNENNSAASSRKKSFRPTIIRTKTATSVDKPEVTVQHSQSTPQSLSTSNPKEIVAPSASNIPIQPNAVASSGESVFAVAEFDYESNEPGDLPLKVIIDGDSVIELAFQV